MTQSVINSEPLTLLAGIRALPRDGVDDFSKGIYTPRSKRLYHGIESLTDALLTPLHL